MKTQLLGVLVALSMATPVLAAIKETPVTYNDAATTMKGFVVYDTAKTAKRPGIVMVPEWWGITKHMHNEARRLARQGYLAFIADMYGDGKTADNLTMQAHSRTRDEESAGDGIALQRRACAARETADGRSHAHRRGGLLLRRRGGAEHWRGQVPIWPASRASTLRSVSIRQPPRPAR
jgi:hypothetical protein